MSKDNAQNGKIIADVSLKKLMDSFTSFEGRQKIASTPVPTGFDELDQALGGGLFSHSVTVLGAEPGFGKTSLALQIAENAAKKEYTVLFFSLEMSAEHIAAKNLCRYINVRRKELDPQRLKEALGKAPVVSARDLLNTTRHMEIDWGLVERSARILQNEIMDSYRVIDKNHGGAQDASSALGPDDVDATICAHLDNISKSGKPALVIVDYLQLLAMGGGDNAMMRVAMDNTVRVLTDRARKTNAAFLLISSVTRDKYDAEPTMAMYKESGLIEYNADCLLALGNARDNTGKTISGSTEWERAVRLVVLKNRYGEKDKTCDFLFYPGHDYFCVREDDQKKEAVKEKTDRRRPL